MDRTSLVRVAVSLVVGTSFLVPLAAPADADATSVTSASKRTIVDSPSGETLYVTNDGNCANVSVREEASSAGDFDDVGVIHELSYGLDNACHVVVLFSSTTKSIAMATPTNGEVEITAKGDGLDLTRPIPVTG
jgi:hypothetical protein